MAKRRQRRRQERRKEHARREGWTTRHSVITGVAVGAAGMLGLAQGASAYTFQVNSGGDAGNDICEDVTPGDCTLRDAVYDANDAVGTDNITFASNISGVTLGGTQLYIVDGTNITGNGAGATTISGNNNSRIFATNPNYGLQDVSIRNLTLTQGNSGNYDGGAIYNYDANLHISDSILSGNHATDGGAIYEYGGYYGGYRTDITDSTFTNNTASDDGGALYARHSLGQVISSTISGNHAGNSNGQVGGGLYSYLTTYLDDDTLTGNSAFSGGGVYGYFANTMGAYNSIVAGNSSSSGVGPDFSGAVYGEGSLFQNPAGADIEQAPNAPSNITGLDPQLGPLQNNGGATPTHLLAKTSPVLDRGLSLYSTDQRGVGRPVDLSTVANAPDGDGSDIGAVELTAAEATVPAVPQPPGTTKKKCKKKKKKKHSSAQVAKKKNKCKKKKKKKHSAALFRQMGAKHWPGGAFKMSPNRHAHSD
jgi:predicted outer membrane repeat protein